MMSCTEYENPGGFPRSRDKNLGRCFHRDTTFYSWEVSSGPRGDQRGPAPVVPARSSVSFPVSRYLRSPSTHQLSR